MFALSICGACGLTMNDSGTQDSKGEERAPLQINAVHNSWYLLATLYGVPEFAGTRLQAKNRIAWNRYVAAGLDDETRANLIGGKRHSAEELKPFSPEELREIATAFTERCKALGEGPALPADDAGIDFSNFEFEHDAIFEGFLFSRTTSFQSAAFRGMAKFEGATFAAEACFDDAAFADEADFEKTAFSGEAEFRGTGFSFAAIFRSVTFAAGADFQGASFSDWALFDEASFRGDAVFEGAAFLGETKFSHAVFDGSSRFINAEMKGETSFEKTAFKTEPPKFFGAKVPQGMVWRGVEWPKPKGKYEAGAFAGAYACLKLQMDRLKMHEDALDFFALEMRSRRVLLGPWRGWPVWLYGILSDYGRSYLRPLLALIAIAVIGAGAFWSFDARPYGEALTLSAANMLNVFGFRKALGLALDTPLAWLKVFSTLQAILGIILLFLFGLGIRNRFRMK